MTGAAAESALEGTDPTNVGAPLTTEGQLTFENCPRCDHGEGDHRPTLRGPNRVVRCLVCNRVCLRL